MPNDLRQTALFQSQSTLGDHGPARSFSPITLLTVLDVSLDETIAKFAETSGKISERIVQRELTSDLELIVGLQDLDRLHQELASCASVLKHCVVVLSDPDEENVLGDPIASITLADLKKRMYDRCCNDEAMVTTLSAGHTTF